MCGRRLYKYRPLRIIVFQVPNIRDDEHALIFTRVGYPTVAIFSIMSC